MDRSNGAHDGGSNLAQKGLAAFQPALVTLSLACLCRFPWGRVALGHESDDSNLCRPSRLPPGPACYSS
jgi:hypothetical protein